MSPAAERVMARADALAAISETPDALTRVYLSTQHLQANQLVGQWMSQAGMTVWQDSVGNICGRYEGAQEGAQAVLLGERHDSAEDHRWQLQVLAQLHARRPALALGLDTRARPIERVFLYLPLEHSENLADQQHAVRLFDALAHGRHVEAEIERAERDVLAYAGREQLLVGVLKDEADFAAQGAQAGHD